jgi:aspartate racemase
MAARWQRVIGIVGGLGVHAHVELERRLLAVVAETAAPRHDQDYPEWVVSSIPGTPDRTAALLGGGPSPVPELVRSLERLAAAGADFALIACLSAYAFLDELRARVRLPILDAVEVTLAACAGAAATRRVGLLATTGTLTSGSFARTARRLASAVEVISLHDLADGRELQEELVMRPIYGPRAAAAVGGGGAAAGPSAAGEGQGARWGYLGGGLKAGTRHDPLSGRPHVEALTEAAARLGAAGAGAVVAGCTEVPLALGAGPVAGLPLFDCMDAAARAALAIARGELPLP